MDKRKTPIIKLKCSRFNLVKVGEPIMRRLKKSALVVLVMALCLLLVAGCSTTTTETTTSSGNGSEASTSSDSEEVDKSALEAEIDSQGTYSEDNYPTSAWESYTKALAQAKEVLNDEQATQDEVDDAAYSLKNNEYTLVNATDREHPKKFDYDWYKNGSGGARDGAWVMFAGMVTSTIQSDGQRYLIVTLANDDATLSEHEILIQATDQSLISDYYTDDVLVVLGTTDEMMSVTAGGVDYGYIPSVNAVEITVSE